MMGKHARHDDPGQRAEVGDDNGRAWAARWTFVMLVEIANYAMLRRHVGLHRAKAIATDIVALLTPLAGDATVRVAGHDLIEIALNGSSRSELDALLADCEALFHAPLAFGSASHAIAINIGAAAARAQDCDDIRLLEEAELALGESRAERRFVVRDVTRSPRSLDPIALAGELPIAIERGELVLHYQPKLHVRRQAIGSVEALVRWQHPTRGLILPGEFIPMAEQSRDIATLTIWAIRQVIVDQRRLAMNDHDVPIFINIAGALLTDTAFVDEACALIRSAEVKIGFEVTETSVIRDPQSAIAHLNVFADMGIVIAIDDYGAGLSSLAYLKQLPARELKIDKLFITQLTSSNRDPLIVRSTIDLAHALEMEVVAEGVETPSALALLSVMGCDVIQGFLISRPIPIDKLLVFLAEKSIGPNTTPLKSFLPSLHAKISKI